MTARLALPLLLFSVAAVTACQEPYELTNRWETWPTTPEPPQPLLGTVWKLHDLPATADKAATLVPPDSHVGFIILEADGRHLTGYAGCQPMTALYRQQGMQLTVDGLARTGSRCHKERFDDVGDRFAAALSGATGYRMAEDDALLHILHGETVTATLIYRTPPKGSW